MAADPRSCSAVIALDTHVVLWWTLSPAFLSRRAAAAIGAADRLGVPAIVFWEVALLSRKGKVNLGTTVEDWTGSVLALPRIEPLSLTAGIALAADSLAMHPDPADRFIVATALEHGVALVTADRQITKAKLVRTVW